jgi:hypothetical protein
MTRIIMLTLICWLPAAPLWAQLPGPGCSCVTDPVTESNTGTIASAVTTGGGAGLYNSQAAYLDSLTGTMGQNVTGTIQTDFPGEEVLPPDTTPIVMQLSKDSLNTYYNAWSVADMVQSNMDADDAALANIEQLNQSLGSGGLFGNAPALLAAVQLNTEVGIHIAQEMEISNALLAAELKMHAVEHAEILNEKTQAHATEATARNWGISAFVQEAESLIP